jgi:DNA-binding LytR/AlgR family response regulator
MKKPSRSEIRLIRRVCGVLLVPVLSGIALTILAPLETDQFSLIPRALYWTGLCLAGALGASLTQALMDRFAPSLKDWRFIIAQALGATLAVAPFVLIMSESQTPAAFAMTLFYIAFIAIIITSIADLVDRKDAESSSDTPIDERPLLMDRLPVHLRDATLFGATSEDHYVRIFTSAGDHLLLMRLADIPDLTQPVAGLSPHRSWWVAEAGIADIRRQQGKLSIALKNGKSVPVSRAGAKRIRDAGWLP